MGDRVQHAAIAVSDLTEAVAFYESVLEFEPLGPDDPDENYVEVTHWAGPDPDRWE